MGKGDDKNRHRCGNDRENPGRSTKHGERRTRIPHERELKEFTDNRHRGADRKTGDDEVLGNLVRDERYGGDEGKSGENSVADLPWLGLRSGLSLSRQNRCNSLRPAAAARGSPVGGRCSYSSKVGLRWSSDLTRRVREVAPQYIL